MCLDDHIKRKASSERILFKRAALMKECSGKKVQKIKVAQNDPLDSSSQKIDQMDSKSKDMG